MKALLCSQSGVYGSLFARGNTEKSELDDEELPLVAAMFRWIHSGAEAGGRSWTPLSTSPPTATA